MAKKEEEEEEGEAAYVGMGGGKGTVTPLLKGKVRIPPPAGHFIDPPFVPRKFFIDPLLSREIFFHTAGKNHKKCPLKNAKILIF